MQIPCPAGDPSILFSCRGVSRFAAVVGQRHCCPGAGGGHENQTPARLVEKALPPAGAAFHAFRRLSSTTVDLKVIFRSPGLGLEGQVAPVESRKCRAAGSVRTCGPLRRVTDIDVKYLTLYYSICVVCLHVWYVCALVHVCCACKYCIADREKRN